MVSSDSPDPRRRNTSRSEMRCYTGSKPERLSSASWCWSFFAAMGDGVGGHVCMFLMLVKPMPFWPQIDSFMGGITTINGIPTINIYIWIDELMQRTTIVIHSQYSYCMLLELMLTVISWDTIWFKSPKNSGESSISLWILLSIAVTRPERCSEVAMKSRTHSSNLRRGMGFQQSGAWWDTHGFCEWWY